MRRFRKVYWKASSSVTRKLQERTIERVGGRESLEVDVRIVSATNRDLSVAIKQGGFREDLFYRLNEINFDIPPLRRRTGDAMLLAHYFLDQNADPARARVKGFSPRASNAIAQYNWPGNVRELENRVRRAVVLCDGKLIEPEHLDLPKDEASAALPTLREAREQLDRELVSNALAAARENVSQAAKILGVSRPTLYELMKSLGMKD